MIEFNSHDPKVRLRNYIVEVQAIIDTYCGNEGISDILIRQLQDNLKLAEIFYEGVKDKR